MSNFDLWNGENPNNDWRPRFGRKVRAWFGRRIKHLIFTQEFADVVRRSGLELDEVDPLIQWYLECEPPVVYWVDDDTYRGKGFSNGSWTLDLESIRDCLFGAVKEIRREAQRQLDSERIRSLDDWLRADIAGTLLFKGEQGGTDVLGFDVQRRLRVAADKRYRRTPRLCPKCRAEFIPNRSNTLKCESCRNGRRRRRA